jgi:hypothetical protein
MRDEKENLSEDGYCCGRLESTTPAQPVSSFSLGLVTTQWFGQVHQNHFSTRKISHINHSRGRRPGSNIRRAFARLIS